MKSELNKKIEEIHQKFIREIQKARDDKDKRLADILERAEEEYVNKVKKDIKL